MFELNNFALKGVRKLKLKQMHYFTFNMKGYLNKQKAYLLNRWVVNLLDNIVVYNQLTFKLVMTFFCTSLSVWCGCVCVGSTL